MTIDQQFLNNYYNTQWNRDPCSNPFKSGTLLLTKISDSDSVIDVGCGRNPFKGKIKNLIGIDPAFDQADVKCTIDQFNTDKKFDVALCLGSINHGNDEDVERHIAKVISWLKPQARIYWRCNPGAADHDNQDRSRMLLQRSLYGWTFEDHDRLSKKFNFELRDCSWEYSNTRIYAEWVR